HKPTAPVYNRDTQSRYSALFHHPHSRAVRQCSTLAKKVHSLRGTTAQRPFHESPGSPNRRCQWAKPNANRNAISSASMVLWAQARNKDRSQSQAESVAAHPPCRYSRGACNIVRAREVFCQYFPHAPTQSLRQCHGSTAIVSRSAQFFHACGLLPQ